MCSATGYPVAERPAYTLCEIDYPTIVPSLAVIGCQFDQIEAPRVHQLVGGAVGWPPAAYAQQPPVIGFMSARSPSNS